MNDLLNLMQATSPEQAREMEAKIAQNQYNEKLHTLAAELFIKYVDITTSSEAIRLLGEQCHTAAYLMLESRNSFVDKVKQDGAI